MIFDLDQNISDLLQLCKETYEISLNFYIVPIESVLIES